MGFQGLRFANELVDRQKDKSRKKQSTLVDLNRTSYVIVSHHHPITASDGLDINWNNFFYSFLTWMTSLATQVKHHQTSDIKIYQNPSTKTLSADILPQISSEPTISEYIHCNANQHNFLNAARTEVNLSLNLAGFHFPATSDRTASIEFHKHQDGSVLVVEKFHIPPRIKDISGKWYQSEAPSLAVVTMCSLITYDNKAISHKISHFCIEPMDEKCFDQIFSHDKLQHLTPYIKYSPEESTQDDWVEVSCIGHTFLSIGMSPAFKNTQLKSQGLAQLHCKHEVIQEQRKPPLLLM